MIDLAERQRQSPLAIVFFSLALVRQIGIVQVGVGLVLLWNTLLAGSLLFVVLITGGGVAAYGLAAWWRSTFHVADGELVVHTGVIRADRLSVPIDRIQSVSVEQELLHRMLGLVKVSVDSAGSEGAEFEITAVTREVAGTLEAALVSARPASPVDATSDDIVSEELDHVVVQHDALRLLRTALTMWPLGGLALIAPFFFFVTENNRFDDSLGRISRIDPWWWAPVFAIGLLALSVIANIARTLLTDWNLTLRASPERLQRTSGLLSRTSRSSSIHRIQVVSSRQNPLQRRVRLRSVTLSTIGAGDLSLVGCSDEQFEDINNRVGLSPTMLDQDQRRVDRRTGWPMLRIVSGVAAIVIVVFWFVVGAWSLLAVVAVVAQCWVARRQAANTRWSLGDELTTRHRVVTSRVDRAATFKANAVVVTQSFFERRRGLGRVHLITAAGTVSVGMVPIDEAGAVRDSILASAAMDRRRAL